MRNTDHHKAFIENPKALAVFTGPDTYVSASWYSNPQIDGIIDSLAVTADPKEVARMLGDAAPILWADVPTLPLYRQQRSLITSKKAYAVSSNPTRWGAGWNMDRWVLEK